MLNCEVEHLHLMKENTFKVPTISVWNSLLQDSTD